MTVQRMDLTRLEYQGQAIPVIEAGEPVSSLAAGALDQAQMALDYLRTVQT
jgi:hypothetical protein